jgi:hypothetical protein
MLRCELCGKDLSGQNSTNIGRHKNKCETENKKFKETTLLINSFLTKFNGRSNIRLTATDFNYETSSSRGSSDNEIEINGELRDACDPSEISDLNERLDNTHVRSRSDSKKRRLEESDSQTATIIEGTVIERTVKFEKCRGFQPKVDKIYSNFPFQMFDYEHDLDFVLNKEVSIAKDVVIITTVC